MAKEVKLVLTWDIRPGTEQEYFEYVVGDFIPAIQKLGLELSEAWLTMYGDGDQPRIMAEAVMPTLVEVQDALDSDKWDEMTDKLQEYVVNFDYKVIEARKGFQL